MKKGDSRRVAVIYIEDEQGRVLMGKRNDSGKWTSPGGHIETGEEPIEGALRELREETGLVPSSIRLVTAHFVKEPALLLYLYEVRCDKYGCDPSKDPDEEVSSWEFVHLKDVLDSLAVPLERNVVVAYNLREYLNNL
jgi:8-oxo-dGTP pyrophosphatase MutT (NUDIX family)